MRSSTEQAIVNAVKRARPGPQTVQFRRAPAHRQGRGRRLHRRALRRAPRPPTRLRCSALQEQRQAGIVAGCALRRHRHLGAAGSRQAWTRGRSLRRRRSRPEWSEHRRIPAGVSGDAGGLGLGVRDEVPGGCARTLFRDDRGRWRQERQRPGSRRGRNRHARLAGVSRGDHAGGEPRMPRTPTRSPIFTGAPRYRRRG